VRRNKRESWLLVCDSCLWAALTCPHFPYRMTSNGHPPAVGVSELFESYDSDYRSSQRSLRSNLALANDHRKPKKDRGDAAREAAEEHEKASQALRQMEIEGKSMGSLNPSLAPKLREYRNELAARKSELLNAQNSLQLGELLGSSSGGASSSRDELEDTNKTLRSSSRRLADTKRSALEAEEIGLDIMGDLHSQRDSIMRSKGHMREMDEELGMSKRILSTMGYRMQTNQLIVGCLLVVLSITVAVVIYLKIRKLFYGEEKH